MIHDDRLWREKIELLRMERACLVDQIVAHGNRIGYQKCADHCPACPHPLWILPNGRRLARPRWRDFYAAKIYKPGERVRLSASLHEADLLLRQMYRTESKVVAVSLLFAGVAEKLGREWMGTTHPLLKYRAQTHPVGGNSSALPFTAVAAGKGGIDFLFETLQRQVYRYNTQVNVDRRGLPRQGAMALRLKQCKHLPHLATWGVSFRGAHGKWFHREVLEVRDRKSKAVIKVLAVSKGITLETLKASGNMRHRRFYLAANARLLILKSLREAYAETLGNWRGQTKLSTKSVDILANKLEKITAPRELARRSPARHKGAVGEGKPKRVGSASSE